MKIIKSLCFLAVIASSACNQPAKQQQETAKAEGVSADTAKTTAATQIADTAAVVKAYIALKDEFLKSDVAGVKTAASALEARLAGIKGCSETAIVAHQITEAGDIKAQRESFLALSKDVVDLVKGGKFKSAPIYVDFCPMADGGKGGYWLSAAKTIENPYFPEHMKECGSVKEQIN
ncbi:DUF3347 domain-containing protein [Mucilaginibacter celer]|uniref:DUF3347 domain-containing protein n=1 Tax=Mucilaginibacter celer TaxID=2305508 RepID=A0A494VIN2_9SPHI|nr:DUF3347 domain-containing protein [Mucilaginibacter celer]AYL94747.1 DUF3347 domain-containing protein [Mucilaginibacter celer]